MQTLSHFQRVMTGIPCTKIFNSYWSGSICSGNNADKRSVSRVWIALTIFYLWGSQIGRKSHLIFVIFHLILIGFFLWIPFNEIFQQIYVSSSCSFQAIRDQWGPKCIFASTYINYFPFNLDVFIPHWWYGGYNCLQNVLPSICWSYHNTSFVTPTDRNDFIVGFKLYYVDLISIKDFLDSI